MASEFLPFRYQADCLDVLDELLVTKKKRALVVMATGTGKTVIAAFFAQLFQKHYHKHIRILFLCDQSHLLLQARNKFEVVLGADYQYGFFTKKEKNPDVDVLFATFQTMRRWKKMFCEDTFHLIIVDEGHHTYAETYLPIVRYFAPSFLLGLTPIPDRSDLKDIRDIFGKEVFSLPLEEAIVRRIVCPIDYRLMNVSIDSIEFPKSLLLDDLNRFLFHKQTPFEVARIIQEKISDITNPRVLIFVPSIPEAEFLAKEVLPDAVAMHARTNRFTQELDKFRQGIYTYAVTVDKLSEGLDIPEINVLVFLRSTDSFSVFSQQLGRGLRKVANKERVLVLDFVGNCHRIEMVHQLLLHAKEKHRSLREKNTIQYQSVEEVLSLTVNEGEISFTEAVISIRTIIKRVLGIITKESLIAELRQLATDLGRTPTIRDLSLAKAEGKTHSVSTFDKYFGTFNTALIAANLQPNRIIKRNPTRDDLISELRWFFETYGHLPTQDNIRDMSKQGHMHSRSSYIKLFGKFSLALEETGLPMPRYYTKPQATKELLHADLHHFFQEKGYSPTYRDILTLSPSGDMYSLATYVKFFGNLAKALATAGLPPSGQSKPEE